jgi:hypothetical protein
MFSNLSFNATGSTHHGNRIGLTGLKKAIGVPGMAKMSAI